MISLKCSAARPCQTASLWVMPSAWQGLPGTAALSRGVPELGVASSPGISLQSDSFTHLDLLLVPRAELSDVPKDSSRLSGSRQGQRTGIRLLDQNTSCSGVSGCLPVGHWPYWVKAWTVPTRQTLSSCLLTCSEYKGLHPRAGVSGLRCS